MSAQLVSLAGVNNGIGGDDEDPKGMVAMMPSWQTPVSQSLPLEVTAAIADIRKYNVDGHHEMKPEDIIG